MGGTTALEALYDHFAQGDGTQLVYFPLFNYNEGSLDTVREMLDHPQALVGLGDAGAHVGTVCDASATTFLLTHWVRDRPQGRLPLERAIHLLSARNARHLGLQDRGAIFPGLRADLNLIDPARLSVGTPHIVRDLPAGGRRLIQGATGYDATVVSGVVTRRFGADTGARPGKLLRGVR